ncbi:Zn-ribbon domain-containing OB-fold protein [Streptomyces sp. NPDC050560]|uniref:Zn-ribbon domain-containing OB-fold protein n=1 Tax=Streptomyces sp. NPDC050560 TaxID=3365630 RepID=UPI0037A5C0C8
MTMATTTPETTGTAAAWNKPWPSIDHDSEEFWAGLARHELLLWTCRTCGAQYWPKTYCVRHENEPWAANMSWQPSSGRGRLFCYNTHHWAFHPGFKDEVPYYYALVELDEGPLISATVSGRPPRPEDVGSAVRVTYEDHPEHGFTLPHFELIDG